MDQNRRRFLRKVPDDLAFIQIERDEVGKVLNVSEGGLRFSSVSPVPKNLPVYFWFSFNLKDRIEGMGEVTWTDLSRTVGGLRFTQLSPAGREQIKTWLSRLRPERDEVPGEDAVAQLIAGRHAGGENNGADRVARFAAKARAYQPTFYRKGAAPAGPKAAPRPGPGAGTASPKARADRSTLSLEVANARVSRVAPAPKVRPAIKIDPPKPPVNRLTLSLEKVNHLDILKIAQRPTPPPKMEPPKLHPDRAALSLDTLSPADVHKPAKPGPLGIDPQKAPGDYKAIAPEAPVPANPAKAVQASPLKSLKDWVRRKLPTQKPPSSSLDALEPAVPSPVVQPSPRGIEPPTGIDAPPVRNDLPSVSPEALDPTSLHTVAEPPPLVINPPEALGAHSTFSLEEPIPPVFEPAQPIVAPPPRPELESPKTSIEPPAFAVEAVSPPNPEVTPLAAPSIEPPKVTPEDSVFSLEREPGEPIIVPPTAPEPVAEMEAAKPAPESSVFPEDIADSGVPAVAPAAVLEIELPKAPADVPFSAQEAANPAGLKVVTLPAPEIEPAKAPALRSAFDLEETNLADSRVALPPALGIEPPKAIADRPALSLEASATKVPKASSRSLRSFESLVTGLVPLQRHLLAKKRQLLRGMVLGMCISTAVTVPTLNYWNHAHAESLKTAAAPAPATIAKNNDVPSISPAQPAQPAATKPSANNVGNVFSGNPVPKWAAADTAPRKQAVNPYSQQALKAVVAKIPKPPAGPYPQQSTDASSGASKTTGKKSMNPTQLWTQVQQGSSNAAVQLAELYIKGDGVPQSCQQARVLLLVASEKRNTTAIKRLRDLDKSPACP